MPRSNLSTTVPATGAPITVPGQQTLQHEQKAKPVSSPLDFKGKWPEVATVAIAVFRIQVKL